MSNHAIDKAFEKNPKNVQKRSDSWHPVPENKGEEVLDDPKLILL